MEECRSRYMVRDRPKPIPKEEYCRDYKSECREPNKGILNGILDDDDDN